MLALSQLQKLLPLLRFMQIQCTRKSLACQWRWTTQTDNNANDIFCGIGTLTKSESAGYQEAKCMVYVYQDVYVFGHVPSVNSATCYTYLVLGLIATYNVMTTIWSGTLPPTHKINAPFEAGVITQQQTCTLSCKAFRYALFTPSHTH